MDIPVAALYYIEKTMDKDFDLNKPQLPYDSKALLFSDIKKGMKVIDYEGDIGTVSECGDPHNVIVQYDGGGRGLYCMEVGCDFFGLNYLYKYGG